MMNIHHLELFYYVAKHGGIAGAVRNIPYGIQQPAVSGQIAKLEESLGAKLFHRRPFSLSPAGTELFQFIEPFFANLGAISEKIQGAAAPQLRIAAPSIALHDYIPDLLHRVRAKFSTFRLNLFEAVQPEAEKLLQAQEIDLAVTIIERKPRAGLHSLPLLELPLVLLVPKKSRLASAADLWKRDRIEETLITFPRNEAVHAQFQQGLKALGVEWFSGIEVNSTGLIECYVANGFGIGLSVAVPGSKPLPGVRRIPLDNFPRVTVGALWGGKLSSIGRQFLTELEAQAKELDRA
ncbi:MAG: LysR family transcriptional regulator [Chthoniobacteraceae bacterium]